MNGAGVIAEILKREGTEFLSCYPRNPLIEACAAIDIRPVLCRQERVGVGIADGYTRIKRGKRNGVFAAQAGPGIENAFPGIAQAFAENVPMMVIPATLPLSRHYLKPVFRAADVYRPVTKWSAVAHSVQELPDLLRRAYHAMRSGKGAIPDSHPLSLGASTRSRSKMFTDTMAKADVVFAVGSSLTRTPFGPSIPPGKKIIHSTNEASDINKEYRPDLGLVGDAGLV